MIKGYWKQFAVLVTAFRRNAFLNARTKIVLTYVLFVLCLLIIFNAFLHTIRREQINENLDELASEFTELEELRFTNKLVSDLDQHAIVVSIGLILVTAVGTFFLSGYFMRPIKQNLETQQRFIHNASHELRTPLAVLKTKLEVAMLEKGKINVQQFENIIYESVESIDRFSDILSSLLLLANIQSQHMPMQISRISLDMLVQHNAHMYDSLFGSKALQVHVRTTPCAVMGNEKMLGQAINNILENAYKYTPTANSVYIDCIQRGVSAIVKVVNTGSAIDENDIRHVFDPFFRGKNSLANTSVSGIGLGLTLVKEIVQKHNGTVSIKNNTSSVSATITLPIV
jgi:signal transduction histidine kinase